MLRDKSLKLLFLRGMRDSSYYFLFGIASKLVTVGVMPFIARTLSVKDFAVYDMFMVVSGILSMISTLGMDSGVAIIIAENIESEKLLSSVLTLQMMYNFIALSTLFGVGLLLFSFKVSLFFTMSQFYFLFIYSLFYLITYNIFNFLVWMGKARKASLLRFLSVVGSIAIGFFTLYLSEKKCVNSFLLGYSLGAAIGLALGVYLIKEYIIGFDFSEWQRLKKELFEISIPYLPASIISYLMKMVDRVIVFNFLGSEALGYYAFAGRIASIPYQVLFLISKGFMPIMFQNYMTDSGKKITRLFYEWYMYLVPLELTIVILSGKFLVLIFGGAKYTNSMHLIPILVLSVLYFGSRYFGGLGYNISRKTHFVPVIMGAAMALNAVVSILLVSPFGATGVAVGTLLSSVFFSLTYSMVSERMYRFGYNYKKIFFAVGVSMCLVSISVFVKGRWY